MMNTVWISSDAVVDLMANSRASNLKYPGGPPANVVISVSHLGANSAFLDQQVQFPLPVLCKARYKMKKLILILYGFNTHNAHQQCSLA